MPITSEPHWSIGIESPALLTGIGVDGCDGIICAGTYKERFADDDRFIVRIEVQPSIFGPGWF